MFGSSGCKDKNNMKRIPAYRVISKYKKGVTKKSIGFKVILFFI